MNVQDRTPKAQRGTDENADTTPAVAWTPSATRLVHLAALVCILTFGLHHFSNNEADVDMWGNAGFVRALPWQEGFLRLNTFSFTQPEYKWINHEWLAEYVYNRVFTAMGNPGLLGIKIGIGMLLLWMLAARVRQRCPGGLLSFLLLILTISTIGYGFSTRPHLFTYLFLALLLTALEKGWLQRVALAPAWILAAVLWTNAHGAFFIGIIVLLLHGSASFIPKKGRHDGAGRRAAWVALTAAAAFAAASVVNPFGTDLWAFVSHSAARFRPYLSEWAPFNPFRNFSEHVDFMMLAGLSLPSLISPRRTKMPARVLLAAALASAILMRRNIPLFAIVSAFAVPEELHARLAVPLERLQARISPRIAAALLLCFAGLNLAAAARFNKTSPFQMEVPRSKYAVDAISFIQAHRIDGNVLVFFDWAEQAIWHLYPNCRVFLDGRFESAYSPEVMDDYLAFLYAETGWDRALAKYPTDMVLCHKDNAASARMRSRAGWRLVYEDSISCLFLKEDTHADVLRSLPSPSPAMTENSSPAMFP